MKIPIIKGIIDRRILINYQVDKEVLEAYLPAPFRPMLVNGKGIAGICLIRLKEVRPKGLPGFLGISSENGAHRFAVSWEEGGKMREGVFIPRRDTSSLLNSWAGGRIFPGEHHLAEFSINEGGGSYEVGFKSKDKTFLSIVAEEKEVWNQDSVFRDISHASEFFKNGSLGYSTCKNGFDGLELKTYTWKASALEVEKVTSSFFEDERIFPRGSIKFDNALLMKNIEHEWIGRERLIT